MQTDVENLIGGSRNDKLTGNALANTITGGKGADSMNGGAGNDTFFARDLVKDTVNGSTGTDRAQVDTIDVKLSIESMF